VPVKQIKIADILPPEIAVRSMGSESAFLELAASIQDHGLIHSIVVIEEGDKYRLVSGDRRLKACSVLGWSKIEAKIADYTPEEAAKIRLHENSHREDPNAVDEAAYLRAQMDQWGWTQTQAAEFAGKSIGWVSQRLKLLELDERTRDLVAMGDLSAKHGYLAARIKDPDQRLIWTTHWSHYGTTAAQAEQQVQRLEDSEILQDQAAAASLEPGSFPQVLREPERCYYCGSTQQESPLLLILTCDGCRAALVEGIEWERRQQEEKVT
jgi:ParB family transcriptional regulator, chromosome partitioning protein